MKKITILLKGNINYDNRVQKEIETFLSLGYKLVLIVWNWEEIAYKNKLVEIIDINLSDHRIPSGAFFTFLKTIIFWFRSSKIVKKMIPEYIHCNDLDTLGILFFLPDKFKKIVIYDAHELFPEHYSNSFIRFKMWNNIESVLIKKIYKIIVPEINRAIFLKNKYKLTNLPEVINNYPKYQPIIRAAIKTELGISDKSYLVCYQGVIGPDREIENIIESFRNLPDTYLLILFGYAYKDYLLRLEELIAKLNLTKQVIFYGKVSPKDMLQKIAACDLGVAFYSNKGINNNLCAPNKVFDYLMSGVKVLTNDFLSLQMLKGYSFVRLISNIAPEIIAQKIVELHDDDSSIPEEIKRKFSWDSFFGIFQQIYK